MKQITIKSCLECPLIKTCKQWKKLKPKQRLILTLSPSVGDFILKDCPLEDSTKNDSLMLGCLNQVGVNNWSGYEEALRLKEEYLNETK